MKNISRTSRRYRYLLQLLFFLIPLSYMVFWFFIDNFADDLGIYTKYVISEGFSVQMKLAGFCISMLRGAVVMYGINVLIRLFRLYEKGTFFMHENVACFKKLSNALLLWVGAVFLTTPLTGLILTMHNPEGQRMIELSLQSADLTALITGGILRVIAVVMENAQNLQEDMELTI